MKKPPLRTLPERRIGPNGELRVNWEEISDLLPDQSKARQLIDEGTAANGDFTPSPGGESALAWLFLLPVLVRRVGFENLRKWYVFFPLAISIISLSVFGEWTVLTHLLAYSHAGIHSLVLDLIISMILGAGLYFHYNLRKRNQNIIRGSPLGVRLASLGDIAVPSSFLVSLAFFSTYPNLIYVLLIFHLGVDFVWLWQQWKDVRTVMAYDSTHGMVVDGHLYYSRLSKKGKAKLLHDLVILRERVFRNPDKNSTRPDDMLKKSSQEIQKVKFKKGHFLLINNKNEVYGFIHGDLEVNPEIALNFESGVLHQRQGAGTFLRKVFFQYLINRGFKRASFTGAGNHHLA